MWAAAACRHRAGRHRPQVPRGQLPWWLLAICFIICFLRLLLLVVVVFQFIISLLLCLVIQLLLRFLCCILRVSLAASAAITVMAVALSGILLPVMALSSILLPVVALSRLLFQQQQLRPAAVKWILLVRLLLRLLELRPLHRILLQLCKRLRLRLWVFGSGVCCWLLGPRRLWSVLVSLSSCQRPPTTARRSGLMGNACCGASS